VDNSLIAFNQAEVNGGGIASLGGNVTLTGSRVFGNQAFTGDGDGIFDEGGSLDLNSSLVLGNSLNDVFGV